LLHNFIRIYMLAKQTQRNSLNCHLSICPSEKTVSIVELSNEWREWRDNLAKQMLDKWRAWQRWFDYREPFLFCSVLSVNKAINIFLSCFVIHLWIIGSPFEAWYLLWSSHPCQCQFWSSQSEWSVIII